MADLTDQLIEVHEKRNIKKNGRSVIVVGAQWGDEGKGKVIDLYSEEADVVVRWNGGPNAGHGWYFEDVKINAHLVASAMGNLDLEAILGEGMVIPPRGFIEEAFSMPEKLRILERTHISKYANIITPMHVWEDSRHEKTGKGVGSTRSGIRPCYEDDAGRRGLRFGDILHNPNKAMERIKAQIEHWKYTKKTAEEVFVEIAKDVIRLQDNITETSALLWNRYNEGKNILYEGAQGQLLDKNHGSYPFVTSSTTTAGGACTGSGMGPTTMDEVVGIAKLVMTRVGDGPFPSELVNENLQKQMLLEYTIEKEGISKEKFETLEVSEMNRIRKKWCEEFRLPNSYYEIFIRLPQEQKDGKSKNTIDKVLKSKLENIRQEMEAANNNESYTLEDAYNHILGMQMMIQAQEYGATTGRPRRTGWLDVAALRRSARINGMTGLALTKLDCLGDIPFVKIVVGYEVDGEVHDEIPMNQLDNAKPIYETMAGWSSKEVSKARSFEELPKNAQNYVVKIAELTGVPIYSMGIGPKKDEAIHLYNPFTQEGIYDKAA